LANGIAKEQARAILPEGLTVSRMYMNGTLRSWIHFIELRSGNGTQKEHQQIALACAEVIAKIFPMASDLVAQCCYNVIWPSHRLNTRTGSPKTPK
jgi:thymidylate synthase (FAD)